MQLPQNYRDLKVYEAEASLLDKNELHLLPGTTCTSLSPRLKVWNNQSPVGMLIGDGG